MASTPNQNQNSQQPQQGGVGGGQFDMNKFFKPPLSNMTSPSAPPQPPPPSASYPPPAGYSFPPQNHPPPFFHPHIPNYAPPDLQHQRSVSFPTPPVTATPPPNPNPNQNPNPGARLMAMLSSPPPDYTYSNPLPAPPHPSAVPPSVQPSPIRLPSSKLPRGRHLFGNQLVYDIDTRLHGEEQPQLEVTPITKYVSDPGLILGHQIAVNKTYICYGLKLGNIRVLNINTALRSLLRGHSQRVTDMSFFAEDVHLLASASIEGRVYVWKISEGPDEEEKPQISGNTVLAIHITGDEGAVHPRVCWHCHKQEILVVAIGKSVLRIDITKVRKGVEFSTEEPLVCPLDKLIDGVQLVGKHEGEVTDLSMCQWMTTRLVSASKDGTAKIWEDRKTLPLLVLRPHDGHPVDAAKFLSAPHRPDHIMLITAGPLNRELKLWASSEEEGWLLPSDAESWRCIQTLELKSTSEPRNEEAFFNQIVALSQSGLLLLANAKKNAIYAIHLEYGSNPAATRMDYLAEFTVTMPILSFTGTSEVLPHGEHLVQVYCVQTQAIQQYALDLSQCLPPPFETSVIEKSESTVSRDAAEGIISLEPSGSKSFEVPFSAAKPSNHTGGHRGLSEIKFPVSTGSDATSIQEISTSNVDSHPASLLSASSNVDVSSVPSPSLPLSPRLSKKLSDIRGDQTVTDYPVDRQMDNVQTSSSGLPASNDDGKIVQGNASDIVNPPVMFKHPTHLVTPFEIMATSSTDATHVSEKGEKEAKIQDVVVSNDTGNLEVEVKVVGETGFSNNDESSCSVDPQFNRKEKSFFSQASDLGVDMSRECCASLSETSIVEEARNSIMEALVQPSNSGEQEGDDANIDTSEKADFSVSTKVPQSPTPGGKGKKQKGKNPQAFGSLSPSHSVSNSAELLQGPGTGSYMEPSSQMLAMHETLNQILTMQKEMQKQMSTVVSAPVTKEGRRLETALGRSIEKASKANTDALWARIQEEITKLEKSLRDRMQQIPGLISNIVNKELLSAFERTLKKELTSVGTNVSRTLSPVVEKTISSSITDSFQRGVGDKAVSQLEKSVTSKLEATVARQIQVQFQTSGKQALQDGLRSCLEASIIPAFEMSCKAMFDQVDSAFKKGMAEHSAATQHQIESTNSQLALALRDALSSASSLTQTLNGELADNQRKLIALAAAGANSKAGSTLVTQLSNGPLVGLHEKVEQPFDPTKELSRLISEHKYEEAFTAALQRSDVSIVSWLCSQVDLQRLLSTMPLPLSQGVLLSLLQQLACDITKDTTRKLAWMTDVAACIIPHDPMIAVHVRPILEQVYQILNHQRSLPTSTASDLSSIRVVMHVINSMLLTCK